MAKKTIADLVASNPAAAFALTNQIELQQGGANTVGGTLTQLKTLLDTLYVQSVAATGSPLATTGGVNPVISVDRLLDTAFPTGNRGFSGLAGSFTPGENGADGIVWYQKSDGKLWRAVATGIATAPAFALGPQSMTANVAGTFLTLGVARNDGWTWTAGNLLYLSAAVNGGLTTTKPSATDQVIQVLGVALSTTTIYFNPSLNFLTHV